MPAKVHLIAGASHPVRRVSVGRLAHFRASVHIIGCSVRAAASTFGRGQTRYAHKSSSIHPRETYPNASSFAEGYDSPLPRAAVLSGEAPIALKRSPSSVCVTRRGLPRTWSLSRLAFQERTRSDLAWSVLELIGRVGIE